ncbi:MAG: hypothetical protein LJE85_03875 [Gammaproteobacteria bacterium]|jgi:hypothetical protein|nr:hypothetical protein [Gammaproteobacteria bacterium]
MTIFAFIAHAIFVRVVLLMAVYAIMFGKTIKPFFFMAAFTWNGDVIAAKLEIGAIMVKGFFVQLHNIHIAAFVFGVARMAFPVFDGVYMTVESGFLLDIVIYFFVTIAAQLFLFGFIERLMAFFAFFFESSMPLNQIPRLDQPFHSLDGILRISVGNKYSNGKDNGGKKKDKPRKKREHSNGLLIHMHR